MQIYVIGDTHFYHNNIIKYCDRPFKDYNEMNNKIIKRWNSTITSKDLVIHMGDFVVYGKADKTKELCDRLNGRKILVRGNHDRRGIHWYLTNGFEFVCDSFTIGDIIFTHRPIPKNEFLVSPFRLNIHGHIHQKESPDNRIYKNVSVEKTNYFPIKLDSILGEFSLKLKRKRR